ncbi:hypothetical protein TcasGA2_TC001776 [Tribolium castaneum]|uniref:Uncharacterized protein n=1 Tax=Tribolium castaneum TaxID=7070 RepID=D6W8F5_TRICA|nr:hypothetical protein TcasGA2_TC001776 [Tribolium castaneum]
MSSKTHILYDQLIVPGKALPLPQTNSLPSGGGSWTCVPVTCHCPASTSGPTPPPMCRPSPPQMHHLLLRSHLEILIEIPSSPTRSITTLPQSLHTPQATQPHFCTLKNTRTNPTTQLPFGDKLAPFFASLARVNDQKPIKSDN